MLDRRLGDINKVQNSPLESNIFDEKNSLIGKKSRLECRREINGAELTKTSDLVSVVIGHQVISSLIHGGFYEFKYDKKHHLYITDGMPPSNFL